MMNEPLVLWISAWLGGALVGILMFRVFWGNNLRRKLLQAEIDARRIQSEGEIAAKRASDQSSLELRLLEERLRLKEQLVQEQEQTLARHREEIILRTSALEASERGLRETREDLEKERAQLQNTMLESSGLSHSDLKKELMAQIEKDAAQELLELRHQLAERTETQIEDEARHLLLAAMQRITSTPSTETTATIVDLPSEDMKGRIIGREGRNIRSFEAVTGTTLMIDETPDSVLISAFDPVKREIAKLALEDLLKDGRIHPATIEAAVERARGQVQQNVKLLGEQAMHRLKLKPAHPEIIELLGKLHFRLSLNQNSLEHSIEVASIASMLASELGLEPNIAKRAALFHDLGKAIDHEFEGSHAAAAARILERYDEEPRVVNAVAASHEEVEACSPYAPLVIIADRISAMRPGARTDSLDSYVQRVKSLERLAAGFSGVKEAFALQAGREIRVIVDPEVISDAEARKLARSISREIEDTLTYPSSIRITVIREKRCCEIAK